MSTSRELRDKTGQKSLNECDSDKDEYQQEQEKIHNRHAARHDICVIKYIDDEYNAALLVMDVKTSRKKWQLREDLPYQGLLKEGDIISVKTTKKQDPLERFFPAKVVKITSDPAVAKQTLDNLLPKQKKSRKEELLESTPTKQKAQEEFLSEIDVGTSPDNTNNELPADRSKGSKTPEKETGIWKFDPFTGRPLELHRSTTPVAVSKVPVHKNSKLSGKNKYLGPGSSEDDSDGEGIQWEKLPSPKARRPLPLGQKADYVPNSCGLPHAAMRSAYRPESTLQLFKASKKREEMKAPGPSMMSTPSSSTGRGMDDEAASTAFGQESTPTNSKDRDYPGHIRGHKQKRLESAYGTASKPSGVLHSPFAARGKAGISQEQKDLALACRTQLRIKSKEKSELYPGAGVYLPKGQFANFQANIKPTNALLDGVNLAVMFFRNIETAAKIFRGDHYGIKAALGPDLLNELMAYINGYHPGAKESKVKEINLISAFSRKLYYIRSQMAKEDNSQRVSTPDE